jgi:flagellar biogenesis protein FliO
VGVLIGLTVLAALALVALKLAARRGGATAGMRVVGRLGLEPRRSIYLVKVGGRFLVIGVGDGPMAMLAEVERPELPQAGAVEPPVVRAWRRVVGGRA